MKMNKLNKLAVLASGMLFLTSCGGATKVADSAASGSQTAAVQEQGTALQPKAGETIIVDVRTVGEWDNDGHANCDGGDNSKERRRLPAVMKRKLTKK